MIGPKVPLEITKERAKRFLKEGEEEGQQQQEPKIKQLFNPSKSVNDEVKRQIVSNLKSVKDRFE